MAICLCALSWWWMLTSPLWYFSIYLVEYVIRLVAFRFNANKAYRSISFEQEAFSHQQDNGYLKDRKHFAWMRYIGT